MNRYVCKHCARYKALYRRIYVRFWVEKQGLCKECGRVVGEKDTCEFWRPCRKKTTTVRMLDQAIEDVIVLQQIYAQEE